MKSKKKCIFMQFDVEEFYPSISKELLLKAITYAKTLVSISDEKINTIMHSRKSLLFMDKEKWRSRFWCDNGESWWHRIMRASGFMYSPQFGWEVMKTQDSFVSWWWISLFWIYQRTCETNLKAVNFLDVTLNLTTGKYQPYNKPDNDPLYINILSNHPPNIIKNLQAIYLKELIIYQQMKHHLISLRIYITMH